MVYYFIFCVTFDMNVFKKRKFRFKHQMKLTFSILLSLFFTLSNASFEF